MIKRERVGLDMQHHTMLGLTCKAIAEVYAQYEVGQLRKRIAELELENYYLRLPSLTSCMEYFDSTKGINCKCIRCASCWNTNGECNNSWDCKFIPEWETFLQKVGATWPSAWDPWTEGIPGPIGDHEYGDTHHAVYTVGRRDWQFAGWGRPLSSLNSPRKKVWDAIVKGTREAEYPD
jgi:hypothetical protein